MTDFGDLALRWRVEGLAADVLTLTSDLATDGGLETAVMLSLFTDRYDDSVPLEERRGYWADSLSPFAGDRFGSRLWRLARAKNTPDTLTRAEEYTREALAWLLEDRVARSVDVVASFVGTPLRLQIDVSVTRPNGGVVSFRFGHVWEYAQ